MNKVEKSFKKIAIIVVMLVGIFLVTTQIDAKIYNSFVGSAVLPKNQIGDKTDFFDLKVKKTTKQQLKVKIENSGNEAMVAQVKLTSAATANNGVINYTKDSKIDDSLKNPITDYVKVKSPKVNIPAKSARYATLELDMNNDSFSGIKLGGIKIVGRTANDSKEANEAIKTENEIAYVIGLRLQMSDKKVKTNLNLIETKASLVNHKTAMTANLQNDRPVLMKKAKIEGSIYKKDSDNAIGSVSLNNVDIAPNSNFNVVYDWNDNRIVNGTYRIKMQASHEGQTWKWDEEFTVSNADKVNDKAFTLKVDYTKYIIIGAAGILLIALIIIILIRRKRNKKEQ